MANTVGPDGTVTINVEGDADEAAKRIEEQVAAAFAAALRSPQVKAAFEAVGKRIATSLNKSMGDSFTKPLDAASKRATKVINGIVRDMQRVQKASQKAFDVGGTGELQAVNALVSTIAGNFEELQNASRATTRLFEELGRQSRAALSGVSQEQRRATDAQIQNQRERSATLQREQTEISANARIAAATITAQGQKTVQVYRTIRQVITSTWQAGLNAVQGFARGTVSVVQGIGRAVASTFRAAGQTVVAFGRGLGRAFSGLGRTIGSALSGVSRAIASALRRDENAYRTSFHRRERDMAASLSRQARAQQRFAQAQQNSILGGARFGALAGGAGLLGFLTSGFERAGAEESIQLALSTVLGDVDAANAKLQELSDYARTTAFDFVGLSQAVLGFTAVTGDIDRAQGLTTFLADLVALTGGNTAQFERAALAFQQIISAGRIEGDELRQLSESLPGVPIVDILTEKFFGGDKSAFAKARRAGELGATITAEGFFAALEEGINERFPQAEGAAVRLAGTLTGLAANLKENFAIFGAQVIRLVEGPIKSFIGGVNNALDVAGSFISGEIFTRETVVGEGAGLIFREPEGLENLRKFRDMLGDMAKAVGGALGLAAVLKVLRLAIIGLTSPLGLVITIGAAVGAVWGRMVDASEKLRSTLRVLGNQIMPTVRAFQQFFSLLGGAVGRSLFGGGSNIFTKMGDGFRYVVVYVARAVVAIRHFINTMSLLIAAGRADLIDDVIVGRFRDLNKSLGEALGKLFNIDQEAINAEGGGIAGFLRNTFLEPVINFFTKTVPDALGGVPSFVGQIFNAIFGGGEEGGPGAAFRAEEGGGGSIATRILNVLEDTFLGPVLSFFRGTFSNGVETAVGVVVGVFQTIVDGIEAAWRFLEPILDPLTDAFRDLFETFRDEGFLGALRSLGRGLLDTLGNIGSLGLEGLGNLGSTILGALETAITFVTDELAPKLDPILDSVLGWFGDTFTPENFAKAGLHVLDFLNEIGRIIGEFATSPAFAATVLIAAGIIAGVITTTLGSLILGALEGLANNADDWARAIVNALTAALEALVNLIPGVDVDLSGLGDKLASALGNAVSGIADNPLFRVIALTFLGAKIAPLILRGIGAAFSTIPGIGGASGIGAGLAGRIQKDLSESEAVTKFRNIGKAVGGAIVAGVVAFEAGQLAGRSGGGGSILLALLTGGAAGFLVGGGIGAAVGVALAGIGAVFGGAAAAAQKAAEEVHEYADALERAREVGQLAVSDAVVANLREEAPGVQDFLISAEFDVDAFVDSVLAGTYDVENAFSNMLADAIGGADLSAEAANLLQDFLSEFDLAAAGGLEGLEAFDQALLSLQEISGLSQSELLSQLNSALEPLGLDANTLRDVMDALNDEARELKLGVGELGRQEGLEALADGIDSVAEGATAVREALANGETAAQIADILNQSGLTAEQRLEALGAVSDEIKDKFSLARDELERLLNPPTQETTIGGLTNQIVADLPSVANALTSIFENTEIAPNVSFAQVDAELNGFRDRISDAILTGFDNGSIDSEAEFDTFLSGLRTQINAANLAPAVRDQLLAVVGEFEGMDLEDFFDLVGLLQSDDATITEASRRVADDAARALAGAVSGGTPMLVQAREVGAKIGGEIGAGIEAAKPVIDAALAKATAGGKLGTQLDSKKPTGAGIEVDDSSVGEAQDVVRRTLAIFVAATARMLRAGANLGEAFTSGLKAGVRDVAAVAAAAAVAGGLAAQRFSGLMYQAGVNMGSALASGLASQIQHAANVAALLAQAAINAARSRLQISSPSRVFVNIGRDIGRGFIKGIRDGETDMAAALDNAINTAMDKAQQTARQRSVDVAAALFEALAPSRLPGGPSVTSIQNAFAAIQQQILGFGGGFSQNAASGFGDSGRGALLEASAAIQSVTRIFTDHVRGLAEERAEARRIARLIEEAQAAQRAGRKLSEAQEEALRTGLTSRQRALIAGLQDLRPGTAIGSENRDALAQALNQIREFGQTALESGQSIDTVIRTMSRYRDELVNQARALGFNAAEIDRLVEGYGLSTAALARYRATQLSLDITTAAGSANIQNINEQLLAIREFGAQLISSGVSAADVTKQLRALRDQLIRQATAFGFNAAQIAALVNQAGLSDKALAEFIRQLQQFQKEAEGAEKAAKEAAERAKAEEARKKAEEEAANRPGPGTQDPNLPTQIQPIIQIYPPYGDPEAMGLTVLNRLAYEGLVG